MKEYPRIYRLDFFLWAYLRVCVLNRKVTSLLPKFPYGFNFSSHQFTYFHFCDSPSEGILNHSLPEL